MNVPTPVTLCCGDVRVDIGTVDVPVRHEVVDSPPPADFFSDKVTVKLTAEVDAVKLGKNLAALLREAADVFDSAEPFLTTAGSDHG